MMSRTALMVSALLLASAPAPALDVHVTADTVGQGYQLITSSGDVLRRSRLHQFLGLAVYDILGDGENQLFVVSQMRFDADFGISDTEATALPQLQNNHFSLMVLYLEARNLGDFLDLRVGRQLLIDTTDFTMFDGALLTFHTGAHVGVDVYSGLEVKNGGDLGVVSSTQLELDGDGAFAEDDDFGIVIGASVFTEGLRDHHARLAWRRVMTPKLESPLGGETNYVDMEKLAGSYHVRVLPELHLAGSAAWDFVSSVLSDARVEARVPGIADCVDIELAWWYFTPTFEGSSIFNIFQTAPLNDVDLRVRYRHGDDASVYLGSYVRLFRQGPDANDPVTDAIITDWGLRGGGKIQLGKTGRVGLDAYFQTGFGDVTTIEAWGGYGFLDDTLDLYTRLSTVLFDDDSRDLLEGTSFGGLVGISYRVRELAKFHLVNELNSNDIEKIQYRVYGFVDLSFWL